MNRRAEAIALALEDYEKRGEKLREPVEFRGRTEPLEVVRLNIDVPLLNHDNSRLGALLATHPDRAKVETDPTTSQSQEVLSSLLRSTEKYKDLRDQLEELGQKEPGVITRDGMLVDGNTRLVALRELGVTAIDVAVLPISADSNDFFDVEMSIQLRKLIHQDYTFTAQLKLIEKISQRFDSKDAVFKALGWQRNGDKRLAEHLRWLETIEEIREISGQDYQFFDNKAEFVKNLDSDYQHLLASDALAAENLKWTRIYALNLGLNKDEIREIDENFLVDQVAPRLESDEAVALLPGLDADSPASDLDDLFQPEERATSSLNMREATVRLLAVDPDDSKRGVLYRTFRNGARELREDRIREQMLTQPLEYLDDIAGKVEELSQNLATYFEDSTFDRGKFEFRAKKMIKAIKELEALLQRQMQ